MKASLLMRSSLALLLLPALPALLALSPAPASGARAQGTTPSDTTTSTPPDTTKRHRVCGPFKAARLAENVAVDGQLDEPVWQNGNAITQFIQRDPNEGASPSQRTEVRIAYDDDAVYVGARLYDSSPDSILARLSRRDESVPADRFSVYLDPLYDRRSGYYFLVNAAGTLFDGTLSNDGWEDNSWDAVWDAKARIDSLGWTCEMKIPFSQLRFANQGNDSKWGINFRRRIERRSEELFVVYQPKKESGFVSRFPDLVGMENVKPKRSLEFLPYVTGKAAFYAPSTDPTFDETELDPNAGFDMRTNIGNALTMNATVNPDFGQVEVDPAVVNLSDVETFYPEKRPFFVEGSANFRFGNEGASDYWGFNWPEPVFFYSRRIGGNGETILGATKVTGKLARSMNLGSALAVTNDEFEPVTAWGDVRLLKEIKDRRYGLGFLLNGAARSFDDGSTRDAYNEGSAVTGLDGWVFLDGKKKWVVSGWSALSHIRGTEQRISDVQTNSQHYFQRPDAKEFRYDPTRTSMTGTGTRLWLNKQTGNVIMNAAAGYMSPAFDANDIGFMTRADVINTHVGGGYKWTDATKNRKYQDVIGAVWTSFDFDGNRGSTGIWTKGYTEFQNNNSWEYRLAYNPYSYNYRRTRGGPVMRVNPGYEVGTYFDTDGKAKLFWWVDVGGYFQPSEDSFNYWFFPGIELKPVSNVIFRFSPGYSRTEENAQYITTYADPTATETYGNRYVFARLDNREFSAGIRLNWAMSPKMSLQFYGQPLISIGVYNGYKALARPRSYEFEPVPIADGSDDFNFKSMRGNAIFRWEYRPGSTFYLVWNHNRVNNDVENNRNDFGNSFDDLTGTDGDNIFLAKLTWYLSL
ncbi:MAG: DUF5916 domain-containing protein [Candidatus Eiseniibacteriota bacterium]